MTVITGFQLLANVTVSSVLFSVGVLDVLLSQLHHLSIGHLHRVFIVIFVGYLFVNLYFLELNMR